MAAAASTSPHHQANAFLFALVEEGPLSEDESLQNDLRGRDPAIFPDADKRILKARAVQVFTDIGLERAARNFSSSLNPALRRAAYLYCKELIEGRKSDKGDVMASEFAKAKLDSEEVLIQEEGLEWYTLLLSRLPSPTLDQPLLSKAIKVAEELLALNDDLSRERACSFFQHLIEYGDKQDVLKACPSLLAACASADTNQIKFGFLVCKNVLERAVANNLDAHLLQIPLDAAEAGCASQNADTLWQVGILLTNLLQYAPEQSVNLAIAGALQLSRIKDHSVVVLPGLLETLVDKHWEASARSLGAAIDNLETWTIPRVQKQAAALREKLMKKLAASDED